MGSTKFYIEALEANSLGGAGFFPWEGWIYIKHNASLYYNTMKLKWKLG